MKKICCLFAIIVITTTAFADDLDDLFADDAFADVETPTVSHGVSVFTLTHELGVEAVLNINSDKRNAVEKAYSGLTSLTAHYQPAFSYQPNELFSLNGEFYVASDSIFWLRENETWRDDVIEARQLQANVHELVAQTRVNQWQLSSGIQTVTLGLADALSVANVLNAQNLSVPGVNDIDETHIPAWTTTVAGSLGAARLKAGSVHTHQINQLPTTGSDLDTGLSTQLDNTGLDLTAEDFSIDNMGWFASVSGVLGPMDWQLNAISQLSHVPVIEFKNISTVPPPNIVPVKVNFPRVNTVAAASSYVLGPFLLKAEVAFVEGLQAQNSVFTTVDYQQVLGVVGFDFNNSTLGRVVAEIQYGTVVDYNSLDLINTDQSTVQWALMYSKALMRERLNIQAQIVGFDIDTDGGRIQALNLEYDINDQWMVAARLIDYVDGEFQFLQGANDRDRVVVSTTYMF